MPGKEAVEIGPPRAGVTEKTKQFPRSFQEKAGQEFFWEGDLNMSLFHRFRSRGSKILNRSVALNPLRRLAFPQGIPACGL